MIAARCSVDAVTAAIDQLGAQAKVSVASVNGPNSVVIAGGKSEVAAVMGLLRVEGKQLSVSHAFHSPLMVPMAGAFRAVVTALSESGALLGQLRVPLMSTVVGYLMD